MPHYKLRTTNAEFTMEEVLPHLPDAADALKRGVHGAVEIIGEEVRRGSTASAVEVVVEDQEGMPVMRVAVSLTVAPLLVLQSNN